MSYLRVVIVDDHEVVRLGLRALLEDHPRIKVVGEVATANEAVQAVERLRPEVVVMDIRLPGYSGIDACRDITARWPETRVIMLTSYAEDKLLFDAIAAGASGYVLKQIGSDDLVRAIERVGRGEALLDPTLTPKVLQRVREAEHSRTEAAFRVLTERELEILARVAEGKTNREIAQELFLSHKTVRNYMSTILQKLGIANRTEAAAYAIQHHLYEYLSKN
jgi:DNA-binding NarL/FixJ family response regulator